MNWPYSDKYYESIGYTVRGFSFEFKNASINIKNILNPIDGLINAESGIEEVSNTLSQEIFFPSKKAIDDKITEYNAIPKKIFINEGYFLYDRSFLIKKTFVTALDKQL